ncbi:MAG: hypothetical protein JO307_14725 [Bryobacterales bacterium]|nr:hypothetical protein [Bryobacterales bacterium]MBV9397530.1 hypothetical protein [Bryobacterales bacterium]
MKRVWLMASIAALPASAAMAQNDDPPGRAARLSYISGTVSFQPGSVEDWVPATLNRPLTTGDRLWTEAGARAEMHIGSAGIRLNGRTNFAFMNLDDRTTQVQVSLGTVSVRLRRLADDESFEIDTPQMALTLLRPGEYRVEVNEAGDATIASVRGGEAEANVASQAVAIHPREQLRVMGADQPVLDTRTIPASDAFDNWCSDRDRREDMSESARHVSRDIPGYADLDGNGAWREYPDYGWVWSPTVVVAGWAPYHYGHWAWIAPWGWTWVDDAPWGYAPFHYGRWVFVGGGWGWVPGPVVPRPVYAPALVAWVGGPSFSVGIAVGGGPAVGWFPLGPREVWVPAYRYSPAYIERVNVTNTVIVNRTVINNINVTNVTYVNRTVPGAVTVVPQNAMTVGRPVAVAAVRVTPDVVARAEVRNVSVVAPERTAVLGPRVQASAAPPAAVVNRAVVARQTPPPPAPAFAQQQQMLRQNPGQPVPRSSLAEIQQRAPAQSGSPRQAIRQVGPPPSAPAQVRQNNPAASTPGQPAQAQPPNRRSSGEPPAGQATQAPAQQQPEFRRNPTPQQAQPQPQAPARPQPTDRQTPAQQQPEFRRNPAPQQAQPQQQAPARPQPTSRQPAAQPAPQSAAQPESRRGNQPSGNNGRENQKGRAEKEDKKRND